MAKIKLGFKTRFVHHFFNIFEILKKLIVENNVLKMIQ